MAGGLIRRSWVRTKQGARLVPHVLDFRRRRPPGVSPAHGAPKVFSAMVRLTFSIPVSSGLLFVTR